MASEPTASMRRLLSTEHQTINQDRLRVDVAAVEARQIRLLAERMAQELDVHVDRAEHAIRSLLAKGLIELGDAASVR